MIVEEDKFYSLSYLDPDERSITNAIQVEFKDGSKTEKVEVQYPLGHRRRRTEAIPAIEEKFTKNLKTRFPKKHAETIVQTVLKTSIDEFAALTVPEFCKLFVI
jgi:2-methylcitrate dehydratase